MPWRAESHRGFEGGSVPAGPPPRARWHARSVLILDWENSSRASRNHRLRLVGLKYADRPEYSALIQLRTTEQKAQQERNQRPSQQLEHAPRLFRTQRRRQRHRAVGLPLHDHAVALALDRADYQQVFVGRTIERNAVVRRSGKGAATAADAGRLRGALL